VTTVHKNLATIPKPQEDVITNSLELMLLANNHPDACVTMHIVSDLVHGGVNHWYPRHAYCLVRKNAYLFQDTLDRNAWIVVVSVNDTNTCKECNRPLNQPHQFPTVQPELPL
jgi:hypothetical protein